MRFIYFAPMAYILSFLRGRRGRSRPAAVRVRPRAASTGARLAKPVLGMSASGGGYSSNAYLSVPRLNCVHRKVLLFSIFLNSARSIMPIAAKFIILRAFCHSRFSCGDIKNNASRLTFAFRCI